MSHYTGRLSTCQRSLHEQIVASRRPLSSLRSTRTWPYPMRCPKHMVLHHLWKKAEGSNDNVYVTPPPELVDLSKEGIVSSVTKDSSSVKEVEVVSKLTKVPHICLPIKFAQLYWGKTVKKTWDCNQALKCATVIYDRKTEARLDVYPNCRQPN